MPLPRRAMSSRQPRRYSIRLRETGFRADNPIGRILADVPQRVSEEYAEVGGETPHQFAHCPVVSPSPDALLP